MYVCMYYGLNLNHFKVEQNYTFLICASVRVQSRHGCIVAPGVTSCNSVCIKDMILSSEGR